MILTDFLSPEEKKARFARLCGEIVTEGHEKGEYGFGTLQEKYLHATVKKYLSEEEDDWEVGIRDTRFLADVMCGNEVFEVQTGSFAPMKKKIGYYLEKTDLNVTVVHPVAVDRWTSKIDPVGRKVLPGRRKSPRHGKLADLLAKMYPLIPYLGEARLSFRVLLLEVQDFRLAGGKRRGERFERIPLRLYEDISFRTPKDYERFLPDTLPERFTVRELAKATGLRGIDAYSAARVLSALGVITPTEPIGRAMAFCRTKTTE